MQPIAGTVVPSAPPRSAGDLADWVELMEAVEALCPVWPERSVPRSHAIFLL
ncbi:hypothetical protein [Dokdonella fugitiva]|jgi:hypothetical protein|uniref:hypothetical protein n=1 Tax=Dokdonella fugitiva TaxID=328517 RepID=UPI0017DC264A|nr:hypothetical protein [Dokdonella fugitiva]MBA8884422.1 hypothetical protein [Dokdonella fugitiva]